MTAQASVVIIGLGNDFRRDDGVGLHIARSVKQKNLPGISIIEGVPDGTGLIAAWNGTRLAIVVDAVQSGSSPGKLHRFEPLKKKMPRDIVTARSTHAFDLVETLELAEILGQLPERLIIYGIEAADFSLGQGLTESVRRSAEDVLAAITADIEGTTEAGS